MNVIERGLILLLNEDFRAHRLRDILPEPGQKYYLAEEGAYWLCFASLYVAPVENRAIIWTDARAVNRGKDVPLERRMHLQTIMDMLQAPPHRGL